MSSSTLAIEGARQRLHRRASLHAQGFAQQEVCLKVHLHCELHSSLFISGLFNPKMMLHWRLLQQAGRFCCSAHAQRHCAAEGPALNAALHAIPAYSRNCIEKERLEGLQLCLFSMLQSFISAVCRSLGNSAAQKDVRHPALVVLGEFKYTRNVWQSSTHGRQCCSSYLIPL